MQNKSKVLQGLIQPLWKSCFYTFQHLHIQHSLKRSAKAVWDAVRPKPLQITSSLISVSKEVELHVVTPKTGSDPPYQPAVKKFFKCGSTHHLNVLQQKNVANFLLIFKCIY